MSRPWSEPSTETAVLAERLQRERSLPRPVAYSCARRGLEPAVLDTFLNPRLKELRNPLPIHDMERAVQRVWEAIDREEIIMIHGDYDVDGMTGTVFLTRTLRSLGANVVPFVPNRSEGYGIGDAGISMVDQVDAKLVLTVDCGTTAVNEIAALNSKGIDVVVLDHHNPEADLPDAFLVNPKLGEVDPEFSRLSGVGVAAKFVHGMAIKRPHAMSHEVYKDALQLVALGTVADVVPLLGENRIMVSFGLGRLSRSKLAGIQALKVVARLTRARLTAQDIAFQIAPRLNAVGRMGDARDALALLLTDDPTEAYRLAEHLEDLNLKRREADQVVLSEAVEQLRTSGSDEAPAMVVWDDSWPVGVVGIAASRLVDKYHKPAFVIAVEGDLARGSARTAGGVSLPEALASCHDLLEVYGGHSQAAGFTVRRENLSALKKGLEAYIGGLSISDEATPWEVDAQVELSELNPSCIDWLERLEPFGHGNPEPLFRTKGLVLAEDAGVVGKRHLKLLFKDDQGRKVRGIAFGQGDRAKDLTKGAQIDALYHASFDTWQGGRRVQVVVRDMAQR